MFLLLIVSLLWAFSFGLIKTLLGDLDASLVAWTRLALSFIMFLPLFRRRALAPGQGTALVAIGAVQYGVMYLTYIQAYAFLKAHEVAMFTVFTPLYVTLTYGVLTRRLPRAFLLAAFLAVAGGAFMVMASTEIQSTLVGIGLLQVSNIAFALGQVAYRRVMADPRTPNGTRDQDVFALLFLGGLVIAGVPGMFGGAWQDIEVTQKQMATLLYLGLVPSGIGFFLWNAGARKVNAGTLAVFNNLKIPLAVMAAVVVFGESAKWLRLIVGGAAMIAAGVFVHTRSFLEVGNEPCNT